MELTAAEITRLRRGPRTERFGGELRAHQASIRELLLADRVKGAFEAVEALPPDLRAAIEPFVTFHCLHSTPSATANATCDVIRAVQSGREAVVAGSMASSEASEPLWGFQCSWTRVAGRLWCVLN